MCFLGRIQKRVQLASQNEVNNVGVSPSQGSLLLIVLYDSAILLMETMFSRSAVCRIQEVEEAVQLLLSASRRPNLCLIFHLKCPKDKFTLMSAKHIWFFQSHTCKAAFLHIASDNFLNIFFVNRGAPAELLDHYTTSQGSLYEQSVDTISLPHQHFD